MNEDLDRIDEEMLANRSDDDDQEGGQLSARSSLRFGVNFVPKIRSVVDSNITKEYASHKQELIEDQNRNQPPLIKHAKSYPGPSSGALPKESDAFDEEESLDSSMVEEESRTYRCPICMKKVLRSNQGFHIQSCKPLHQDKNAKLIEKLEDSEFDTNDCEKCGKHVPILLKFIHQNNCPGKQESVEQPEVEAAETEAKLQEKTIVNDSCHYCGKTVAILLLGLHEKNCEFKKGVDLANAAVKRKQKSSQNERDQVLENPVYKQKQLQEQYQFDMDINMAGPSANPQPELLNRVSQDPEISSPLYCPPSGQPLTHPHQAMLNNNNANAQMTQQIREQIRDKENQIAGVQALMTEAEADKQKVIGDDGLQRHEMPSLGIEQPQFREERQQQSVSDPAEAEESKGPSRARQEQISDLFPALNRKLEKPQDKRERITRPAQEFMADEVLDDTVRCEQCDDELIKMFRDDHVCDPKKIQQMKINLNGELAEPLYAGPPKGMSLVAKPLYAGPPMGMSLVAEPFKPSKPAMVVQEGPNPAPEQEQRYQCDLCNAQLPDVQTFSAHLDSHEIMQMQERQLKPKPHRNLSDNNANVPIRRVIHVDDNDGGDAKSGDDVRNASEAIVVQDELIEQVTSAAEMQAQQMRDRINRAELQANKRNRAELQASRFEEMELQEVMRLSKREHEAAANQEQAQVRAAVPNSVLVDLNRERVQQVQAPQVSQEDIDAALARQIADEDQRNARPRRNNLDRHVPHRLLANIQNSSEEIQQFFNAVGPAMRDAHHIFGSSERRRGSENQRVNNMNEQQFTDHMNELFMRDNQKPIKMDILSQLPRSRYVASEGSKEKCDDHEHRCTICITDYSNEEEILTLTCFHKFHADCVEKWFSSQNWCPICRTKIDEEAKD